MDGLQKGVYVAMYKADFTEAHQERKLVFSVYCAQAIKSFQRVSLECYPRDSIQTFDDALERKLETKYIGFEDDDY